MQDFLPFLDHGHSRNRYQWKEQSIFYKITVELKVKTIPTSNTEPPKLVNKRNFWRSHAVSHGSWGDRTSDCASDQVGRSCTSRLFYIVSEGSCWWVKWFIFYFNAWLSCQMKTYVSKNGKWSGQWTITNIDKSWFGGSVGRSTNYLWMAILVNFSTHDSLEETLFSQYIYVFPNFFAYYAHKVRKTEVTWPCQLWSKNRIFASVTSHLFSLIIWLIWDIFDHAQILYKGEN